MEKYEINKNLDVTRKTDSIALIAHGYGDEDDSENEDDPKLNIEIDDPKNVVMNDNNEGIRTVPNESQVQPKSRYYIKL